MISAILYILSSSVLNINLYTKKQTKKRNRVQIKEKIHPNHSIYALLSPAEFFAKEWGTECQV